MAIKVHEANIHDSKGAKPTIENLAYKFPRLSKILADGGYQGDLAAWVKDKFGWELEVVLRPKESSKKFNVIPKSGLWKELSHGLRTIEDSPLTTSFLQKQQKQW